MSQKRAVPQMLIYQVDALHHRKGMPDPISYCPLERLIFLNFIVPFRRVTKEKGIGLDSRDFDKGYVKRVVVHNSLVIPSKNFTV